MATDASQPFLWGSGGRRLTPEEILLERKASAALGSEAMSTAPVGHWSAGLNRVAQGLMAGYDSRLADDASKQNGLESSAVIQAMFGGATPSASAVPNVASGVAAAPAAPVIPPEALSGNALSAQPAPLSGGFAAATPDPKADPHGYAMEFYKNRGYSPVQAAGIVGGLRGETANLNTSQVHDGGIGLGIAGWNGDRLKNLNAFAQQKGTSPTDLNTQLEFVDNELRSSEGTAFAQLQAAQSPQQAGQAMLRYFRPKDWNVPGAHPERARYAGDTFQKYGSGTQVASLDPTIGLGAGMDPRPTLPPDAMAFNGQAVSGNPVSDATSFAPQSASRSPNVTNVRTRPVEAILAGQAPPAPSSNALARPSATGQPQINPAILKAMTSPYVSEQARGVAKMLFQNNLEQQQKANDPLRQLQIQEAQGKVGAMPLDIKGKQLANMKAERELQGEGAQPLSVDERSAYGIPQDQPAYKTRSGEIKFGPAGTKITNHVGDAENSFAKEAGKVTAERFNALVGDGQKSRQMMSDMSTLLDLGKGIGTGKGAQLKAVLGPYATAAGINVEGLSDIQAYEAIVNRVAPSLRVAGSGAQSDYELKNFLKSIPSLGNTQEGNELATAVMTGLTQNKVLAADIASKALAGDITRPEAEKQLRNLPDPMQPYKDYKQRKTNVDDLVKKYGGPK